MTIRSDLTIDWSVSPRIIEVAAPSTEITIQDLLDTLRYMASQVPAMDEDEIVDSGGKESLGGGFAVGLTVKLLNARLKFGNRSSLTTCYAGGGNLVAVDTNGETIYPIEPASNVTVALAQAISAVILSVDDIRTDLAFMKQIERGRWKIINNQMIFYDTDGITPIRTFNLKDKAGNPASESIYERVPI